jgi:hypothetical protein
MAEEFENGVAYLKALKQSTVPQAASAAAAAAAPAPVVPTSTQQHDGPEKRRSPRYKCEGSMEMREEGCDVRTWATFTDISLHGCYVEAQATYPVDTVLHLKLQANGIRVETKGQVRVSYPYLGMGIAFNEISEDNHTRLKELLGTLSHPTVVMGPGVLSSLPTAGPLESVPLISDAPAAVQKLVEFFETRHIMTREDFLKVLEKSQKA